LASELRPAVVRLGQVVMTCGVRDLIAENAEFAKFTLQCLSRHRRCDWGDLDQDDQQCNNQALQEGCRILSAYNDDRFPKNGVATLWIITEADRSATTLLFPDEY
jgi:hypothetical protein